MQLARLKNKTEQKNPKKQREIKQYSWANKRSIVRRSMYVEEWRFHYPEI